MIPFVTVPSAQQAPMPTQAAAAVAAPTETGLGRLSPVAVSATLNPPAVQNNTKGSAFARPATPDRAAEPEEDAYVGDGGPGSPPFAMTVRFSSPFLAQLLAQAASPGEADALAALYANDNTPGQTLNSGLMEVFSLVKYMPSFAAAPSPEPVGGRAPEMPVSAQLPEAPIPAASMQLELPLNVPSLAPAAEDAPSLAAEAVMASAAAVELPAPRPAQAAQPTRPGAPELKAFAASARPLGVAAYLAAFSRNDLHLAEPSGEAIQMAR